MAAILTRSHHAVALRLIFILSHGANFCTAWGSRKASSPTSEGQLLVQSCQSSRNHFESPADCIAFLTANTFTGKSNLLDSLELQATLSGRREAERLAKRPPVDHWSPTVLSSQRVASPDSVSLQSFHFSHLWMTLAQQDTSCQLRVSSAPKAQPFSNSVRIRSSRD